MKGKLLCPRCEKPIEEHEDGACPKSLSRRFFLGAIGTAFAVAAVEKFLPNVEIVPSEDDAIVVGARPKVHKGSAIVIDHIGGDDWRDDSQHSADLISRHAQRPIIIKVRGEVLHYSEAYLQ